MRSSASSVASRCSWGGCTLEAAEAVCDADGDLGLDLFGSVASLVDKSLLRRRMVRTASPASRCCRTIREYALEQLQASARRTRSAGAIWPGPAISPSAGRRAFMARTVSPGSARLAADHDNFRAALTWSLADPDRTSARTRPGDGRRAQSVLVLPRPCRGGYRWLEQLLTADTSRAIAARK